ncbi:conserved hypothetical protein [Streptomyces himastatinicus ATCC 53653]|uniref:Uncharacterized protein n=1 Tax=Streptomyces himastatinicus ATCC 53653 TaxID=457427 RepID=D9WBJ7_9ACTN|nr:conserved hypothetical protein [Streptomyces himastatinicus ATCC 53653]
MPVEFLSDEQGETYGTFAEKPTRPGLEPFLFLEDVDWDLIALRRNKRHQFGARSRCARCATSVGPWGPARGAMAGGRAPGRATRR